MRFFILIFFIIISIDSFCQNNGTINIILIDCVSKLPVQKLDSVLINDQNGKIIKIKNIESKGKSGFIFKSLTKGSNKFKIFRKGYNDFEKSYMINISNSNVVTDSLHRKKPKWLYTNKPIKLYLIKAESKDSIKLKNTEIANRFPASCFKGGDSEFNSFIYSNLDSLILKKYNLTKLEIQFQVNADGVIKIKDVIDRGGQKINPEVYDEIKRVFDLLPNWTKGEFKLLEYLFVYQL